MFIFSQLLFIWPKFIKFALTMIKKYSFYRKIALVLSISALVCFASVIDAAWAAPHFANHSRPVNIADSDTVATGDSTVFIDAADSVMEVQLEWPEYITVGINNLLQAPMFGRSQVGIMVYDLDADSVIFDHNSLQLMRPASVMKVLTATTALNNLGGRHLFTTGLYITGEVQDSVLHGDVYIKGGFDPLFNADDMMAFVQSLKEDSIYAIDGRIYADVSFKDTLKWGEGWCWDDKEATLTPLLYEGKDIFMDKFMQCLTAEGISHPATYSRSRAIDQNLIIMCERSHSISQMLNRMMKNSDNLYAESLFYQLGSGNNHPYASGRNSAEKEYDFIRSLGLSPDDYSVADGSGLSLYNYLTPHMVVRLLRHAWHTPSIYDYLYPSLPIAGVDGTLKSRMQGTPAYANVRAKTGTVRKVSTLAGYATASNGHRLAFAIFNQGIINSAEGRNFQDKVCVVLTQ